MKPWIAVLAAAISYAQPPSIDAKTRDQVIASVLDRLNRSYVYPDVARKMADAVHEHQQKGDYDRIDSPFDLARTLTADLQAVSHDRHLQIEYSVDPIPELLSGPPLFHEAELIRKQSFGFEKLVHLSGNIGYLQLRDFNPDAISGQEVAAGMTSLADSKALIIDLRYTGGGRPRMVQLIASYLFGTQPVHLNDLYWRPTDSVDPLWTLADLPGRRIPNADVYTSSPAVAIFPREAFAYDLQALKRATVVGEITDAVAHTQPSGNRSANISQWPCRAAIGSINPVTKTDWEYVGVRPDIGISAEKALATAHLTALRKIISHTKDPALKARLEERADSGSRTRFRNSSSGYEYPRQ